MKLQESSLTLRQACALIRNRVRNRLAQYKGQDIWNTSFFIERLDLAAEAYDYQAAQKPDGTTAKIDELIEAIKEELVDFMLVEDIEGHVEFPDTRRNVACEACANYYDPTGLNRCPNCRHPNLYQVAESVLDTLSERFDLTRDDPIAKRVLAQTEGWRIETSYQTVVTCFEAFHKGLNELLCDERGLSTIKLSKLNLFQNIQNTRDWFHQHHNLDLFIELSSKEIHLLELVFNKRHVIAHNGGIVDEKYIERTNGNHADIGKPVPLSKQEIMEVVALIRRVVQAARAAFS